MAFSLLEEIKMVEQHIRKNMTKAYYDHTIEEWLGCYLHPLKNKLLELISDAESQLYLTEVE